MQEGLLAETGVEASAPERQPGGVAAHDPHPPLEADQPRESRGARRPPGVQLDGHDLTAAATCQEAGGPAQPGAQIQHARGHADPGQARQRVDGGQPAVVVLVELEEVVGGEGPAGEPAAPGEGGQHLGFADRMAIVEVDDVAHEGLLTIAGRWPR